MDATLFDNLPPATRRTDPVTSRDAERSVTRGMRQTHCTVLLDAVRRNHGRTSAELAHITGLERHEAARRLADLKGKGLVVQSEARLCAITGNRSVTWWAL